MNNLPPEILCHIVSFLPSIRFDRTRVNLSCVCRSVQLATEFHTFRIINLHSSHLPFFEKYFYGERAYRRTFLKELNFVFDLRSDDLEFQDLGLDGYYEALMDREYTRAVVWLLRVLKSWEELHEGSDPVDCGLNSVGIKLTFTHAPGLINMRAWRSHFQHICLRLLQGHGPNIQTSYNYNTSTSPEQTVKFVTFQPEASVVHNITTFMVDWNENCPWRLSFADLVRIAGCFPNIREFVSSGIRREEVDFSLKNDQQQRTMDIGLTLSSYVLKGLFNNLKSFHFNYMNEYQVNFRGFEIEVLHPLPLTIDFLGLGFHSLSQLPHLKSLFIHFPICISAGFFQGPTPEEHSKYQSFLPVPSSGRWPSLEVLELRVMPRMPQGQWYLHSPSDTHQDPLGLDGLHLFETDTTNQSLAASNMLDPVTFNPLLLSILHFISQRKTLGKVYFSMTVPQDFSSMTVPQEIRELAFEMVFISALAPNLGFNDHLDTPSNPCTPKCSLAISAACNWGKGADDGISDEIRQALEDAVGPGGLVKLVKAQADSV